jgi:hypothetical protein
LTDGRGPRAHAAREILGQWIVAAGIEKHEARLILPVPLHVLENQPQRDRLEIGIDL